MTGFITHIAIHFSILAVLLLILGLGLYRTIGRSGVKSYKCFFPFYNLFIWFKWLGLPWWAAILFLQGYWYPVWWIQVVSILVITYSYLRTSDLFKPAGNKPTILVLVAVIFSLLLIAFPTFHYLILLIPYTSIVIGLMLLKSEPFNSKNHTAVSFNFRKQAIGQFKKNSFARIAVAIAGALVLIALYAPYIANNVPIYVESNGQSFSPINDLLRDSEATFPGKDQKLRHIDWSNFSNKITAPIPYAPEDIDPANLNFVSPSDPQYRIDETGEKTDMTNQYRHWLGTDKIGRDLLSGLLHGTQTTLVIGLISMGIAALIGIFMGIVSGFFGNTRLMLSRARIWFLLFGIFLGYFYGFIATEWRVTEAIEDGRNPYFIIFLKYLILITTPILFFILGKSFERSTFLSKKIPVPVDSIVVKTIEIIYSVPGLLLLIVIAGSLEERSLTMVMVIIGILSWTGIARVTRAEVLRIKQESYIESAQALGLKDSTIIFRHILPNALGPVFVIIAFGMASAVLMESTLSFLGIGVPEEVVTWGSMLNIAFENHATDKLWLVVTPGLAIFTIITIYNLIGEGLRDALDPKLKK